MFLLDELENQDSIKFAKNLYKVVIQRVRERINEEEIWLMKYLVNPDIMHKEDIISCKRPAKSLMINFANRILQRQFLKNCDGDENENSEEVSSFACQETS